MRIGFDMLAVQSPENGNRGIGRYARHLVSAMLARADGHQYVLWLQHGSSMSAAGVMPSGPDNKVIFDGDPATADGAAVSVETDGPVPAQPSDDVVAAFSFDA